VRVLQFPGETATCRSQRSGTVPHEPDTSIPSSLGGPRSHATTLPAPLFTAWPECRNDSSLLLCSRVGDRGSEVILDGLPRRFAYSLALASPTSSCCICLPCHLANLPSLPRLHHRILSGRHNTPESSAGSNLRDGPPDVKTV